jgi:hypothetical protein
MEEYSGTLKITNPITLERWIHQGKFQKEIDDGYIFATGCGRFRTEVCTCFKCRKGAGKKLQTIIDRHYKIK